MERPALLRVTTRRIRLHVLHDYVHPPETYKGLPLLMSRDEE
jgi:hypothetical protein